MAGVWNEVFRQNFTAATSVIVTHNTDLEYISARLIVGNEFRPDLVRRVIVDPSDPTNALTVDLVSSQTGTVQILEADTYPVGAAANNRQYQAFTYGQHYTYAESLGATSNAVAAYLTKLTLTTPSVEAGDYLINWSFLWMLSNAGAHFDAIIDQDAGTTLWNMVDRASGIIAAIRQPASGFAGVTLTAGVHTFDIEFMTTVGVAYMYGARLSFWRTA